MLALMVLACGLSGGGADCALAREASAESWEKVADYYTRTADLLVPRGEALLAEVDHAARARSGAARSAQAAFQRSRSGLTDLRTGHVFKDPRVAASQRAEGRSASARAADHARAALVAFSSWLAVEDARQAKVARAALARSLMDLPPPGATQVWALRDTELADRAREATLAAWRACPASDAVVAP